MILLVLLLVVFIYFDVLMLQTSYCHGDISAEISEDLENLFYVIILIL